MFANFRFAFIRPTLRRMFTNIWKQPEKTSKYVPAFYIVQTPGRKSLYSTHSGDSCNKISTISLIEYEEIKSLTDHPEKILIDVREPEELKEFGKIPSSVNIPLGEVPQALCLSEDAFKERFGRDKPSPTTEIIFHCRSGKRSTVAAEAAVHLGYKNVKNYAGSWNDWAKHNNLPK